MSSLKTHHLGDIAELNRIVRTLKGNYDKSTYSYANIEEDLRTIVNVLRENEFPRLTENELLKTFNQHDLYVDVITYAVLDEYFAYSRERKLPPYVYVYAIITRPFLYNVILCNLINEEQDEFKKLLLDAFIIHFGKTVSPSIVAAHDLLMIDEFRDYEKYSALQQFKYFIDCSFDTYCKPYSDFNTVFQKDVTYVVIHLSYNVRNTNAIFAYNDTRSPSGISLTEEAIATTKYLNEFEVFQRSVCYEIINMNCEEIYLSDENIFVVCYDNDEDLHNCIFSVCKFKGQSEILNNVEAKNKLNGLVYACYTKQNIEHFITIDNKSKIYDEPEDRLRKYNNEIHSTLMNLYNPDKEMFIENIKHCHKLRQFMLEPEIDYLLVFIRGLTFKSSAYVADMLKEYIF